MQAFRWSGLALRAAFGVCVAAWVTSCGSGAVSGNSGNAAGTLAITPSVAVVYSELPSAFSVTGGSGNYSVLSSNQAVILPIPSISSGLFNIVPLDVAADTPVTLTVLDNATKATASASLTVKARTIGSTVTITPSTGQVAACGTALCSGGDAEVKVVLTQGGVPLPNRSVQFDVVSGSLQIITSTSGTSESVTQSMTSSTDSTGTARVRVRASSILSAETALIRITDLASGFSQTASVSIAPASGATLTVVPSTIQFTGTSTTACATGISADVVVIGGRPPYQVTKPAGFNVNPTVLTFSGGRVTITATGQCARTGTTSTIGGITTTINDSGQVMSVVDSNGSSANVSIHNDPAPVTSQAVFTVSPTTVTLDSCQAAANIALVGGTGQYLVATGSSAVLAQVSYSSGGSGIGTIRRNPGTTTTLATSTVTFSDGQTVKDVTVILTAAGQGPC